MKSFLLFLTVFASHCFYAQNELLNELTPRLAYTSDKTIAIDKSEFILINSKDTLYAKLKPKMNLSFLKESNYSGKNVIGRYKTIVFQYTDANSKKVYVVKQWSSPIVVFMDKRLPKKVIKKFEAFFSQIKGITNLNISFTNKLENSNYHIKTTSVEINAYNEDYTFYSEEDRINSPLTGGTYQLQTDKNNKFYSGILTINLQGKSDDHVLKQLKQLFYMSLGNFTQEYSDENSSVINNYYNNSDTISDFDLAILKIHYAVLYECKINGTIFNELIKLSKTNK